MDNMNVDPLTGDLWVGAQNSLAEFMSHDKNPILPCGSRVSAQGGLFANFTCIRYQIFASGREGGMSILNH